MLSRFTGGAGGANPGGVIATASGALLSTTTGPATSGPSTVKYGTVFRLIPPAGAGAWSNQTLYQFSGQTDGSFPAGNLIEKGNAIYGETNQDANNACGVVFRLTP